MVDARKQTAPIANIDSCRSDRGDVIGTLSNAGSEEAREESAGVVEDPVMIRQSTRVQGLPSECTTGMQLLKDLQWRGGEMEGLQDWLSKTFGLESASAG